MKIHVADGEVLKRLLHRKKRHRNVVYEVDIDSVLREILTWANRLVPSQAGSILLDDPFLKMDRRKKGKLYFAACFGRNSQALINASLPSTWGIAGRTYSDRKSRMSRDVRKDGLFYPQIDRITGYRSRSIICAPIIIDGSAIGVIELVNRKSSINYEKNDLALLEIFAGYTATLIQNALIGRSLEELSKLDNLTGLYNDRYFFHRLELEIRRVVKTGGDVTLIFFDLDRFKEVNDSHGHLAGSTVLREVADVLRSVFRGADAVLARYGGDEYVVILLDMSEGESLGYAEKLRQAIQDHVFIKKRLSKCRPPLSIKGIITCSIGVASLSRNVTLKGSAREIAEMLIKSSDGAMYYSKEHGRNRVYVSRDKKK